MTWKIEDLTLKVTTKFHKISGKTAKIMVITKANAKGVTIYLWVHKKELREGNRTSISKENSHESNRPFSSPQ